MKAIITDIFLLLLLYSCTRIPYIPNGQDNIPPSFLDSDGAFIINEGNFTQGNGSLSFYSFDSARIYNDIFTNVNNRILGDVPNSMKIFGENAYIIVNNSGKIEVVNKNTLKSVKSISGLISPRNIAFIDKSKAYVTSMYSDSVVIINLTSNSISGYINISRSSEAIEVIGQNAFVSEWIGGNEVMVINTINDQLVSSIAVGAEPESMALDQNSTLWVLCNGGWARTNFAELIGLNTQTFEIKKRFIFPSKLNSPSCLQINGSGDTLYYLESGVRRMSIGDQALPSTPLITETDQFFYKIGVNPVSSDIFITDAIDYQQRGFILHYKRDGTFISKYQAGVIPGNICFKIFRNDVIE